MILQKIVSLLIALSLMLSSLAPAHTLLALQCSQSLLQIRGPNGSSDIIEVQIPEQCLNADGTVTVEVLIKASRLIPVNLTFDARGKISSSLESLKQITFLPLYPKNTLSVGRLTFPAGSTLVIKQDKWGHDAETLASMVIIRLAAIYLHVFGVTPPQELNIDTLLATGRDLRSLLTDKIPNFTDFSIAVNKFQADIIARADSVTIANDITNLVTKFPGVKELIVKVLADIGVTVSATAISGLAVVAFGGARLIQVIQDDLATPDHLETEIGYRDRLIDVPTPSSTPVLSPMVARPTCVIVDANSVNLRNGPGTNYAVIGFARKGFTLSIMSVSGSGDSTWYEVAAPNGGTAWISGSLVTLCPVDNVGVGNIPAPPNTRIVANFYARYECKEGENDLIETSQNITPPNVTWDRVRFQSGCKNWFFPVGFGVAWNTEEHRLVRTQNDGTIVFSMFSIFGQGEYQIRSSDLLPVDGTRTVAFAIWIPLDGRTLTVPAVPTYDPITKHRGAIPAWILAPSEDTVIFVAGQWVNARVYRGEVTYWRESYMWRVRTTAAVYIDKQSGLLLRREFFSYAIECPRCTIRIPRLLEHVLSDLVETNQPLAVATPP